MTYELCIPNKVKWRRRIILWGTAVTLLVYTPHWIMRSPVNNSSNRVVPEAPLPKAGSKPAPAPNGGANTKFRFTSEQLWGNTKNHVLWRVVGAAEGTVSVDGNTTDNYKGHTDPGNGVHNRGAYSYQFGNAENLTPQESDQRQMAKIKRYGVLCEGFGLTEFEYLNCLDLINQAPLCVGTESDGGRVVKTGGNFIDRLKEAKASGLKGDEAILKARVQSFINPSTGSYDTTFVSVYWLEKDQKRRMTMMSQAIELWVKEQGGTKVASLPVAALSFNQTPYQNTTSINNVNPNGRGFTLTEGTIKSKLWWQGQTDRLQGLPQLDDSEPYLAGYNSVQ